MPPTDPNFPPDPVVDFETATPSRDFLELVTFEYAWRHRFCAVSADETHDLIVATEDTPPSVIAKICERMPRECMITQASNEQVYRLIARAYEKPWPT